MRADTYWSFAQHWNTNPVLLDFRPLVAVCCLDIFGMGQENFIWLQLRTFMNDLLLDVSTRHKSVCSKQALFLFSQLRVSATKIEKSQPLL